MTIFGLSKGLSAALRASNDASQRSILPCKDSARTLPPSFRSKDTENNCLAGADSAHTDSFRSRVIKWRIEEPGDHVDTARLDLTTRRVLFEIDKVLFKKVVMSEAARDPQRGKSRLA